MNNIIIDFNGNDSVIFNRLDGSSNVLSIDQFINWLINSGSKVTNMLDNSLFVDFKIVNNSMNNEIVIRVQRGYLEKYQNLIDSLYKLPKIGINILNSKQSFTNVLEKKYNLINFIGSKITIDSILKRKSNLNITIVLCSLTSAVTLVDNNFMFLLRK